MIRACKLIGFSEKFQTMLEEAIVLYDKLLKIELIKYELCSVPYFSHTMNEPPQVWEDCSVNLTINFIAFRPKWYKPWQKRVCAYTSYVDGKSGNIHINVTKFLRNPQKLTGTIAHEIMHLVKESGTKPARGYGHGNNSPKGKQKSVPYTYGRVFYEHAKRISY